MNWNAEAKNVLKSELVRRGISHEMLVMLLKDIGIKETKNSIDSKMSRGSFSAAFLLQCLNAIGCCYIQISPQTMNIAAEPIVNYKTQNQKTND